MFMMLMPSRMRCGNRLIMMDRGRVVLERAGQEKKGLAIEYILKAFMDISIECGN